MGDTEAIPVFGTVQHWPKLDSTLAELVKKCSSNVENGVVSLLDGQTRESVTLAEAFKRAEQLDFRSRCALIAEKPVVCVRVPASVQGLVAILAVLLSNCVLLTISSEVNDPEEVSRVLSLSRASVFISTREWLWECEYTLSRLRIRGASIGGEGPLAHNSVDLRSPMDPKTPRVVIPNASLSRSLEDPSVLFYDEQSKLLYEMTERGALTAVLLGIRRDNPYWRERVVSNLGALCLLTEILPRILSSSADSPPALEDVAAAADEDGPSKMVIVFDSLYGTRVRRVVRARPGGSKVGPAKRMDPVQPEKRPSDIGSLFISCARHQLSSSSSHLGMMIQTAIATRSKNGRVTVDGATRGLLAVSGSCLFRQVLGSVSRTVEAFHCDSKSGKLWFVAEDEVQVTSDGVHIEFARQPSKVSASSASTVDWKKRSSAIRPPRHPNGGGQGEEETIGERGENGEGMSRL